MQISNLRQQLQEARKEFAAKQRALEVHLQLLQVASIEISTSGNLYCIFILRNRFRALPQAEVDAKKQEIQEHRQAEQEANRFLEKQGCAAAAAGTCWATFLRCSVQMIFQDVK